MALVLVVAYWPYVILVKRDNTGHLVFGCRMITPGILTRDGTLISVVQKE